MRWIVLFGTACVATIVAAGIAFAALGWADALGLNAHGVVALGLGVLFTVGLGIALMALVFHSSRSGHDEVTIHLGGKSGE